MEVKTKYLYLPRESEHWNCFCKHITFITLKVLIDVDKKGLSLQDIELYEKLTSRYRCTWSQCSGVFSIFATIQFGCLQVLIQIFAVSVFHMEAEHGESPNLCLTCGKTFKRKRNLTEHLRCHTGEKFYICSVCDKPFSRSTHLTNHMKIHSEETPYVMQNLWENFQT